MRNIISSCEYKMSQKKEKCSEKQLESYTDETDVLQICGSTRSDI